MSKGIAARVEAALNDPDFTDEQARWLDGCLHANMQACGAKSMRALFLFMVFALVWVLLKSASIGEISVLGVKVQNANVVALVLPVLAAFCIYRFHCFEGMASVINDARKTLYRVRYPNLYNNDIEQILSFATMMDVDNNLSNLESRRGLLSVTSEVWLVVSAILMLAIPGIVILWMAYATFYGLALEWPWRAGAAGLSVLLLLRSAMVFALHIKLI